RLGSKRVEIRWHLIEQNEDRRAAIKKLQPVLFVWSLGDAGPEGFLWRAFAKLIGNLAPEEMVGVVATVESGDVGHLEGLGVGEATAVLLAQLGMLRKQAEADEQVGLAAAHGLLEVKDALGRNAGESGHALANEVLHALGDVSLLEELGAVAFRSDQFVKLLDLVAELDGERIGMKLAGITDGLHMRASWKLLYSTS